MDTKPQTPLGARNNDDLDKPPTPVATPAPLANYDFDRDLDATPASPGPLLKQPTTASPKPVKTNSKKSFAMVMLTILLLAAIGAAGYFYWQTTEVQKQADTAHQEVSSLTTENAKLKADVKKIENDTPKTNVADRSESYGKYFYAMLTSYEPITKASTTTAAQLASEKTAIEKAYKDYYKLPATAEPLKDKEIEVMTVYKEGDATRALVYWASDGSKPADFMPFVKTNGTWKYASE